MTLTETLRRVIRDSGETLYQISKATGVAPPVISRFISDDAKVRRDIRLETADKLAAHFKLKLTADKPKKATKK